VDENSGSQAEGQRFTDRLAPLEARDRPPLHRSQIEIGESRLGSSPPGYSTAGLAGKMASGKK
jgi:hypothetical protein